MFRQYFRLTLAVMLLATVGVSTASASYVTEVMADNPIVYYQFSETSGSTITDSSGNANHGTYNGDQTQLDVLGAPLTGSAVNFTNGAPTNSVTVPALGSGLSQITVEVLANSRDFVTWDTLYNMDGWSGGYLHYHFKDGDTIGVSINGGGPNDRDFTGVATANQWMHIAMTYDSTTGDAEMFIDGASVGTQNFGGQPLMNLNAGHIGAWNGNSRQIDAVLDEFAVYSTVLDADRIAVHAAAAVPEPSSLLLVLCGLLAALAWRRRAR